MFWVWKICLLASVLNFVAGQIQGEPVAQRNPTKQQFVCPKPDGEFEDSRQCDKYWVCRKGVARSKLCDDGLVFDPFKGGVPGRGDPCDSPYVVDCGDKTELQEPSLFSEYCPRRHGFFADPDSTTCDVFYTCIKGLAVRTKCAHSLHYDKVSATCTWPDSAKRVGCAATKQVAINGFTCPRVEVVNDMGTKIVHPTYPNLEDCQKFYICLNGDTPQEASCNLGEVFNEASMLCDFPENVDACNNWYENDPRFADYYVDSVATAADPGKQDVIG